MTQPYRPGDRDLSVYTPRRVGSMFTDRAEDVDPFLDQIRRISVPAWLSDELAARIYRRIIEWKYAGYSGADVEIQIPMDWVPVDERVYYMGAKLFGQPVQLNPLITEAHVSTEVRSA